MSFKFYLKEVIDDLKDNKIDNLKRYFSDFTEIQNALDEIIPRLEASDEYNVFMFLNCLEDHTLSYGCDYKAVFQEFELYKVVAQLSNASDTNDNIRDTMKKIRALLY